MSDSRSVVDPSSKSLQKSKNTPPVLSAEQWLQQILKEPLLQPATSRTWAAFSTHWAGGSIVTHPALVQIPWEDHLVHRGDGVFEAIKVLEGRPYLFHEHWTRFLTSARSLHFEFDYPPDLVLSWVDALWKFAKKPKGLLRMFLSRGVGGFGVSLRDCSKPQITLVLTELSEPTDQARELGVSVGFSKYAAKDPFFARIKSCNYLLNVLMKEEALQQGRDYHIGLSPEGHVLESSTENLAFVNSQGEFCYPSLEKTLAGTTLNRLCQLIEATNLIPLRSQHQEINHLENRQKDREVSLNSGSGVFASVQDLLSCRAAYLVGTTLDILPIREIQGHSVSRNRDLDQKLLELLRADQKNGRG